MRRHAKRFVEKPVEGRAQRVVRFDQETQVDYALELACGHVAYRRYRLGPPHSVICMDCPSAGGFGGGFER